MTTQRRNFEKLIFSSVFLFSTVYEIFYHPQIKIRTEDIQFYPEKTDEVR